MRLSPNRRCEGSHSDERSSRNLKKTSAITCDKMSYWCGKRGDPGGHCKYVDATGKQFKSGTNCGRTPDLSYSLDDNTKDEPLNAKPGGWLGSTFVCKHYTLKYAAELLATWRLHVIWYLLVY